MLNYFFPNVAFAAGEEVAAPFIAVLNRMIGWFSAMLFVAAALVVVIAAVVYLTAGGNQERIQVANRMILYAVIAVAIAFISRGVISIILYFVNG